MYLPLLAIDLREHFQQQRAVPKTFSPATQVLLIKLLLQETGGRVFSPSAMAAQLGYSNMTMTRAFDELEAAGPGQFDREGHARTGRFATSTADIWHAALTYLRSPVKQRVLVEPMTGCLPGVTSGLSALALTTSLAAPTGPVVALGGREW